MFSILDSKKSSLGLSAAVVLIYTAISLISSPSLLNPLPFRQSKLITVSPPLQTGGIGLA